MTEHPVQIRPELLARLAQVETSPLTLVSAPAGSGKTTLLSTWRESLRELGRRTAWLQLAPWHSDLASFLEDLASCIERDVDPESAHAPLFAETLLRRIPHLDAPDPEHLAHLLTSELLELGEPLHLFLDDYHRLPPESLTAALLEHLIRARPDELRLCIGSRGARPAAAARLLVEGQALELGPDDLSLRGEQIDELLRSRGLELDPETRVRLLATTSGWATGVLLGARAIAARPSEEARDVLDQLGSHDDVFDYIAGELLEREPEPLVALLETAAVSGPLPRPLLEQAAATRDASQRIDEAVRKGLLLRQGDEVGLHPLWESRLRADLRARLGTDESGARAADLSKLLEGAGEPERSVEIAAEWQQPARVGELIDRYGVEWVERGRHESVSRWMDVARKEPSPASLQPGIDFVSALLTARSDPDEALHALEKVASRFRALDDGDRELAALHNTIILAVNEGRVRRARRAVLQVLRLRRLATSRHARHLALLFLAMGAFLGGRHRLARRLSDRAARYDFAPRERGALMLGRAQLAMHAGEWDRVIELTEDGLADPDQRRHGPSYYLLLAFHAAASGFLGRPEAHIWLARLEEARDSFRAFRLNISEAEVSTLLARLLAHDGQHEAALDELENVLQLCAEIRNGEATVTAHALMARSQHALGRSDAAMNHARQAIAPGPDAPRVRVRPEPWFTALAAGILAEEGEAEEAATALDQSPYSLDCADVPLGHCATRFWLARIAERQGDSKQVRSELQRAWQAIAAADLRWLSPELDTELVSWAAGHALRDGIHPETAQRFETPASSAAKEPALRIESLGTFRLWRHGVEVDAKSWRGSVTQRLFQRLLMSGGRPASREVLATELWPDFAPDRARNNLRVALSRLRRVLEPERGAGIASRLLAIDGERVGVTAACLEAWDVARFTEGLDRARAADRDGRPNDALTLRQTAVHAYLGPLWPENLEDWLLPLRGELEERFLEAGHAVLESLLEAQRNDEAIAAARHLASLVPSDEGAWQALIRGELQRGDRAGARRIAGQAELALERELGVAPSAGLAGWIARANEA